MLPFDSSPAWSGSLRRFFVGLVWSAGLALLVGGCSKPATSTSSNPKEKRYPLSGEVLGVNTETNVLKIKHQEIPGYMPAMTMEFPVSQGDAANAKVGQKIRGELVTEGGGDFRLEKIWVDDAAQTATVTAAAKALVQDTVARGNKAYREVGETAPDFVLLDQDGKTVDSSRFRGKQILLNFIFTRCPVPTMCPAAVARFQQTQREARAAGVKNLELVSITLDPAFDTPGVLKTYAATRAIDTSNYSLLTGPENAIKSLLSQFGVLSNFEGELLNHTLATVLIDEKGRIVYRADGSRWEVGNFLEKMKKG